MLKGLFFLPLLGRIMLAALFIPAGINKAMNFAGTSGYIGSKGLPVPDVLAALTIALEIGGGILLVIGFLTRWVSLALAIFCVLTAVIFHAFWAMQPPGAAMQQIMFMKNIAIAGGFLGFAYFGAGPLSVDRND
jgi:putative oxidoreductase